MPNRIADFRIEILAWNAMMTYESKLVDLLHRNSSLSLTERNPKFEIELSKGIMHFELKFYKTFIVHSLAHWGH